MEATSLKAQDLRIGNWVQPIVGDPGQVTGIMNQEVKDGIYESVYVNYQSFLPQHLMSIPLSEEWLVRLGFESVNGVCFKKGDLIIEDADSLWEVSWMPERLLYLRMIEHVHQLQNLYHALTGNELTV